MTIRSVSATNLMPSYVNGLQLSWASTTTLAVAAGQCRDSTNGYDMVLPSDTVLDSSIVNAVNGLDIGAMAKNSYYVFVIADSTDSKPTGLLLSLSLTAPFLPVGYDIFRRIGYASTNGSNQFFLFHQCAGRKYIWDTPIVSLAGGFQTGYTAIDLAGQVPSIPNCLVGFNVSYTPYSAALSRAKLRPSGSASTTNVVISGAVAAVEQMLQVEVVASLLAGSPKIDYAVSSGDSLSLYAYSFVDVL